MTEKDPDKEPVINSDNAAAIAGLLQHTSLTLALAETCTGGLISDLITNQPGASAYFKGSVVAYSYDSLVDILKVNPVTLAAHGAVSKPTVCEMAQSVREIFHADIGIAICGITGPGGGSPQKPVGTTWMSISHEKQFFTHQAVFDGNRRQIKEKMAQLVLDNLFNDLKKFFPGE